MFTLETAGTVTYLRSRTNEVLMRKLQDALDILGQSYAQNTWRYLFLETNFAPEFYDLKTRLAGDILQKFSNYQVKAAILGAFALPNNPRFQEFMFESNKGGQLRFSRDEAEAIAWLTR